MARPMLARLISDGRYETVMGILTDPAKTGGNFRRTVAAGDHQALVEAARSQHHAKMIAALIKHGAEPRAQNHEPLRVAVLNANTENIITLIKEGYQALAESKQASDPLPADILVTALDTCPERTILALLALEVELDPYCLSFAVAYEMDAVVEALLEKGVDPNAYRPRLPLPIAACSNYVKTGELLLRHGANPALISTRAHEGKSALKIASERGHGEFLALLKRYQGKAVRPVLEREMAGLAAPGAACWF